MIIFTGKYMNEIDIVEIVLNDDDDILVFAGLPNVLKTILVKSTKFDMIKGNTCFRTLENINWFEVFSYVRVEGNEY